MQFQKISITLPADTVQEAKALAGERGVSMSRLLAALIHDCLADLRTDRPPGEDGSKSDQDFRGAPGARGAGTGIASPTSSASTSRGAAFFK